MNIKPYTFEPLSGLGTVSPGVMAVPDFSLAFSGSDKGQNKSFGGNDTLPEDLKMAYDKGYTEGLEAGKAEVSKERMEIDGKIAAALEGTSSRLEGFFQTYQDVLAKAADNTARLALQISHKIAGDAIEKNAEEIIEGMVRRSMEYIYTEPGIDITVNAALAVSIKERVENIAKQKHFEGKVNINGSDAIAVGDCTIKWSDGGAKQNAAETWKKIENIIISSGADLSSADDNKEDKNLEAAEAIVETTKEGSVVAEEKIQDDNAKKDGEDDKK